MSVFINLMEGVFKRTKAVFFNKYRKIGLSWIQVRRLKNLNEKKIQRIPFYNRSILFYNRHELRHSIDEIFINEIYKTDFTPGSAPVIFDCGANIGLSVIYFKKHYPHAKIIAFEPDEFNYKLLIANVDSMQLNNIEIRKQAVWIENTVLTFNSEGSTSSRITLSAPDTVQLVEVDAVRLKDLIKTKIDLLKLDIEGAEYEVVKDIESQLHMVDRLFLEYHGRFDENHKLEELLAILTRNHFYYYITEGHKAHPTPFSRNKQTGLYDIQLNIYCFKT